MTVELINTGTELLLGHTLNTHLAFLGEELFPLGLRIHRQVTVPDGEAIAFALRESMARAEIILMTGGLGPTTDDLSREISAEVFGLKLVEDPAVWESICARLSRRGIPVAERNRRQAQVPEGSTVLHNANGTAPGLYLQKGDRHLFLLPGPPSELRPMFMDQVMPILRGLVPGGSEVEWRNFLFIGMGESNVEAAVGDDLLAIPGLELGYCARPGAVEVRCIGRREAVEKAEEILRARLSAHLAAAGRATLEQAVVERLTALGRTVATAESCTGGMLANRLTNVPGASAVFRQGFVTYANAAKVAALGVPEALLKEHGAVSEAVARAMAEGAMAKATSDFGLSTTGVAGPGGGTEEKPVGTVFVALARQNGETQVAKHFFPGGRLRFKELATQAALDLLRKGLEG